MRKQKIIKRFIFALFYKNLSSKKIRQKINYIQIIIHNYICTIFFYFFKLNFFLRKCENNPFNYFCFFIVLFVSNSKFTK